ncbi:MAG: tripartite tricarboxylate transporter substrate binding protein [Betaproteobacteria bacterium]|nr:tripartite tricarboxylate transporter substrate binding protein [Betaproteobacteria bacterium]
MWESRGNIPRLFNGIIAIACLFVFESSGQSYPVKPIRVVVGYPAGGGADITARPIAQKLSEHLGQPVIVENRPGASSSIAIERVVTSPADGYTLLQLSSPGITQAALRTKLPYDLERDLAPVSLLTIAPGVFVVHPSLPARNVKELIALARSRPGELNYGSSGTGSTGHFAGELFNLMAKVKITHVPYKGVDVVVATASGEIEMGVPTIPTALPLIEARRLRALAVTSAKRASIMPSIPTIDESGLLGYDRSVWFGLVAPAGVPKDIIARLNAAIVKVMNTPELKKVLNQQGLELETNTPEQFAALIRNEIVQSAKLVKSIGLKVE